MKKDLKLVEKYTLFILSAKQKESSILMSYYYTVPFVACILCQLLEEGFLVENDDKKPKLIAQGNDEPETAYERQVLDVIKNREKPLAFGDWVERLSGAMGSGKNMKLLLSSVIDVLEAKQVAKRVMKKGFIFNSKRVLVDENRLNTLVQEIRTEFLEDGKMSEETVLLAGFLEKNSLLKNFFSKYERQNFKLRMKEIKGNPDLKKALAVIDDMDAALVAVMASTM